MLRSPSRVRKPTSSSTTRADVTATTTPSQTRGDLGQDEEINDKACSSGASTHTGLSRAGGGSIINTASFVAIMGAATAAVAYTASKGAVRSMSAAAVIHARENTVNALGPVRAHRLLMRSAHREKKHAPLGNPRPLGEAPSSRRLVFLASEEVVVITAPASCRAASPSGVRDARMTDVLDIAVAASERATSDTEERSPSAYA